METIKVDAEGGFSTTEKRICTALFSTQSQSKYQRFVFIKQQECVFVPEPSVHGHYRWKNTLFLGDIWAKTHLLLPVMAARPSVLACGRSLAVIC